MDKEQLYEILKQKVELALGRAISTPRDFDYLSTRIFDKTKMYIAPITLKRFWGYLGEEHRKRPFRSTLNILSRYIGYVNIEAFEESWQNGFGVESDFLTNDSLQISSVETGTRIELLWHPDRCVTVEYLGLEMFKVVESLRSKLKVGDTFFITQIIDGEPLILRCLVHDGGAPTNYVCGRINGVRYRVLNQETYVASSEQLL